MQITRQHLNSTLLPDLNALLADWAAKHGLRALPVNCSFTDDSFKIRGGFELAGAMSQQARAFLDYATGFHGFKPEDLGATFSYKGQAHTLIGWRPRAKFKVIARRASDGIEYTFPQEIVLKIMGRERSTLQAGVLSSSQQKEG